MLISLSSPVGQLLNGRKVGDNFIFNGREDTITKIIYFSIFRKVPFLFKRLIF